MAPSNMFPPRRPPGVRRARRSGGPRSAVLAGVLLAALPAGEAAGQPGGLFRAVAPAGLAAVPGAEPASDSITLRRRVGVILRMTPCVTYENEIVLDLEVENSTLGPPILVAGQSLPTFGTRRVQTRLRLRDGESNLLAGFISQEERQILKGFPGLLRLPILKQLFSANNESANSTDIVMLLTPRIVRTHQLTQEDVGPIHIGTRGGRPARSDGDPTPAYSVARGPRRAGLRTSPPVHQAAACHHSRRGCPPLVLSMLFVLALPDVK